MRCYVSDLNCEDKEYKFNISVVTEKDWINFAHSVVLNCGKYCKELALVGFKVVIRDNQAKAKIYFQDNAYHELECILDVLGRKISNYNDKISLLWRDVMKKYYGEEYLKFVEQNLEKDSQITND